MKRSAFATVLLLLLLPASSFALQWYGTGDMVYTSRAISPRAQALGKITSCLANDPLSGALQPGAYGRAADYGAVYTHAAPIGLDWNGDSGILSGTVWARFGTPSDRSFVLAANFHRPSLGTSTLSDNYGQPVGDIEDYRLLAGLSVATEWIDNTILGASIHLYRQPWFSTSDGTLETEYMNALTVSLSALRIAPIRLSFADTRVVAGINLVNANYPKVRIAGNEHPLPVIIRVGPGYEISLDALPLDVNVYSELQIIANSSSGTVYRGGLEVWLYDILALRGGTYQANYFGTGASIDPFRETTWGWGIRFPFERFSSLKSLEVRFDYLKNDPENLSDWAAQYIDPVTHYAVSITWTLPLTLR